MNKTISVKALLRAIGLAAEEAPKEEPKKEDETAMEKQKCPDCGTEYEKGAEKCPECGAANPSLEVDKKDEEMSNAATAIQLAALNTQLSGLAAQLKEQQEIAVKMECELQQAKKDAEAYKAEVSKLKAEAVQKINAEAVRLCAAQASVPLDVSADVKTEKVSKAKNLTGLARVEAAFKEQAEKASKPQTN